MKTAEEHKKVARYILNHYSRTSEKDIICLGKRFQRDELNAFKAGMEYAAEIAASGKYGSEFRPHEIPSRVWKYTSEPDKAILTTAQQLTEIPR